MTTALAGVGADPIPPRLVPPAGSGDEALGRRLASIYGYLAGALYLEDPEQELADRLAGSLDAQVTVFDGEGRVEITSSDPIPEAAMAAVSPRPGSPHSLDAGGWRAHAVPIGRPRSRPRGWLVVSWPGWSDAGSGLSRLVAGAAAPLISAIRHLEELGRDQERAVRGDLLEELLRPDHGADRIDRAALASRAERFGIRRKRSSTVAILRGPHLETEPGSGSGAGPGLERDSGPESGAEPAVPPPGGMVEAVESALEGSAFSYLLARRERSLTILVQGGEPKLADAFEPLLERWPGLRIGIGREVASLSQCFESMCDARAALEQLEREPGPACGMLDFESLDLGCLIAAEGSRGQIGAKLRKLISELKADPVAYEALVAYLSHQQSVTVAARSLYLHPNSMRYRLGKAEAILGGTLKDPATITALYIAMATDARGGGPAG